MTEKKWSKKEIKKFHKEYKGSYFGDVSAHEIIRLSVKYIKGLVLDVGSGSGSLVNSLSNAIGIDLVPQHSSSIKGDVTNLPFGDCSFDTVFCTELLEHLCDNDLENGLKEIRRVLSERGHFIITVPYKEMLEAQMILCPKCGVRFHRWGHIQVFDEERMYLILRARGLEVIKIKILPIWLIGKFSFLKYFQNFIRIFLEKANFSSCMLNLLVIARKK